MNDLGQMHYFLGLEVWKRSDEIFLNQGKYTLEILKKFKMKDCKSMPIPMVMDLKNMNDTDSGDIDPHLYRHLIGSFMYLVNTRPYICYAVNFLIQFMSQPKHTHWITAKHVLRYLQGTIGYCLRYAANVDLSLEGYADVDWEVSAIERKSTSG
jgi:hypothetical protein